jgi:hypothetical protein
MAAAVNAAKQAPPAAASTKMRSALEIRPCGSPIGGVPAAECYQGRADNSRTAYRGTSLLQAKRSLDMYRSWALVAVFVATSTSAQDREPLFPEPIGVDVPHISTDKSVAYDYDIVYVRARRAGDEEHQRFFTDFSQPVTMEPGADLMLLHPDGSEELLVEGGNGSVTDPMISFDGEWVFYSYLYDLRNRTSTSSSRSSMAEFTWPREGGRSSSRRTCCSSRTIPRTTSAGRERSFPTSESTA